MLKRVLYRAFIIVLIAVVVVAIPTLLWLIGRASSESLERFGIWSFIAASGGLSVLAVALLWREYKLPDDDPRRKRVQFAGRLVALGAACLAMVVSIALKLGSVTLLREDARKASIHEFFTSIDGKDFGVAWNLIHPERKVELHKRNVTNEGEFAALYSTTLHHHDPSVVLVGELGGGAMLYRVSFDVQDYLPDCTLDAAYFRTTNLERAVADGVMSESVIDSVLIPDIRKCYDISDDKLPAVRSALLNFKLQGLFTRKLVSEVARTVGLAHRTDGKHEAADGVWTHEVLLLTMKRDGDAWKIRAGLSRPEIEAEYAKPPMLVVK